MINLILYKIMIIFLTSAVSFLLGYHYGKKVKKYTDNQS